MRQRRLIQPGFQRKRIDALSVLMQKEVDACMEQWTVYHASQKKFDAYVEMNQLTFRIVAKALFSTSIEESGLSQLSHLISALQDYIIREVRQPHKRWWLRWSGYSRGSRTGCGSVGEPGGSRSPFGQSPG